MQLIAAQESDSGVGGGCDTEEIITDEGGNEVVAEMEESPNGYGGCRDASPHF